MRHLVFIPTIRESARAIRTINNTFTLPTDLVVMDGSDGIVQTLNYVLNNILDDKRHSFFTKMDDDFLPTFGWQNDFEIAFNEIESLGALGLYTLDESGTNPFPFEYSSEPVSSGLRWREHTHRHFNIPGCHFTMPTKVAREVGEVPIIDTTKYQFYEDGWKCRRLQKLGYRYGQLDVGYPATLFEYDDSDEYKKTKAADTALSTSLIDTIGMGNPYAPLV